jgi:phosphate transport system substrate-binding protein
MEQIYQIYTGAISNWNELDGPDLEIYVNDRASTSGTRATFVELIKNSTGYALEDFEEDGGTLAVDNVNQENANVVTAVSGSQQAIGYVGLGYVNEDTCPAVEIDGVYPSTTTVKDGTYPISRSLHMYTLGTPTGAVKDFIDYVKNSEGQDVVEDEGFIKI